jgi:hypothetical protein
MSQNGSLSNKTRMTNTIVQKELKGLCTICYGRGYYPIANYEEDSELVACPCSDEDYDGYQTSYFAYDF